MSQKKEGKNSVIDMIRYDIYLTAIGLTPGGSSTSHIRLTPGGSNTAHIYTQTVHIILRKKNWEVRAVPRLANYTLAFALQLTKKHGKTSVRVVQYKNNEAQYKNNEAQYKNNESTIQEQ
jgi:hypothetical protein